MEHIVYQSKGLHETNITMHEPSNSDKGLKSYRFFNFRLFNLNILDF
jgi:hypothetical protein